MAFTLALAGVLSLCAPEGAATNSANAPLTEVGAIVVGGAPKAVLAHPSLPLLYVSDAAGDAVAEVDLDSGLVERRFPVSGSPVGLALSDDGTRLYAAAYFGGRVVALDVEDGACVSQSGELDHPWDVAMVTGPRGRRLLAVTQHYGDVISFLDPVTLTTEGSVSTGYWPYQMAVDNVGRRLYVVSYGSYRGGELQCIDLDRLTPIWQRTTGRGSFGVCLDVSAGRIFVTDDVGETVSCFTTAGEELDRWTLPGRPMGAALGAAGDWLLTAVRTRDQICAVDAESGRRVFDTAVGRLPVALEWLPGGFGGAPQALAVANEGDGTISVLAAEAPLAGFLDVPADHIFAREIRALALRGALSGYPQDGGSVFLPEDLLTRAQMAKILVTSLALHTEVVGPAVVQYWDVPVDAGSFPFDVVQEAGAHGIVYGMEEDPPRFGPWENVTRLQLVRMVVRAAQAVGSPLPAGAGESPFADVSGEHPDLALIMSAHAAGLVAGAPGADGLLSLNPEEPVTRGQTAKIVCRLLGKLGRVSGS